MEESVRFKPTASGGCNPLSMYPIGSIYPSVSDTSPSDLFGGMWELIGAGKVILDNGMEYIDPSNLIHSGTLTKNTTYDTDVYVAYTRIGNGSTDALYLNDVNVSAHDNTGNYNVDNFYGIVKAGTSIRCTTTTLKIFGVKQDNNATNTSIYIWQRTA